MLKLVKEHANAKQNPEAELLILDDYSRSPSTLSIEKNNGAYFKK